ncbi:unnamed protein product [Paramecium sonneborni]|uniref:Uncharacterized protein n=1 Tax=Paramecium sonneborni TaxID=65129 RepID=A0A8S1RL15_9CILI|nr:unnamed protein product [Paramecium sonneborni]
MRLKFKKQLKKIYQNLFKNIKLKFQKTQTSYVIQILIFLEDICHHNQKDWHSLKQLSKVKLKHKQNHKNFTFLALQLQQKNSFFEKNENTPLQSMVNLRILIERKAKIFNKRKFLKNIDKRIQKICMKNCDR